VCFFSEAKKQCWKNSLQNQSHGSGRADGKIIVTWLNLSWFKVRSKLPIAAPVTSALPTFAVACTAVRCCALGRVFVDRIGYFLFEKEGP